MTLKTTQYGWEKLRWLNIKWDKICSWVRYSFGRSDSHYFQDVSYFEIDVCVQCNLMENSWSQLFWGACGNWQADS